MSTVAPLIEFLDSRVGSGLRSVSRYGPDSYEVVYVREDIDRAMIERRLGELHHAAMVGEAKTDAVIQGAVEKAYGLIQMRDGRIVIRLRTGDRSGVVVSLEPEAEPDLDEFIDGCLERLADRETSS